ncbi:MAG: hypothetical protein WC756_03615 [Taibaiella sp.]|jgi:hypothetical protein
MTTNINSWSELKNFANTLTEEQLQQPVRIWGESFAADIESVEVLDEDMINPSGEGCEPVSAYADEPETLEDEPVIYPAGRILLDTFGDRDKNIKKQ